MTLLGHIDDVPVTETTIRSDGGAQARILSWGAVVRDMTVPVGATAQRVVLGLERWEDYPAHSPHMGAIAGRFANRIAGGRFVLDGVAHDIPRNQGGKHALHGGGQGFGKRPWRLMHADARSVTLGLVSPDGDAGFPGTLTVTCTYVMAEPATLRVVLMAVTDAPTHVNLAHHSYFNLDGAPDILDHELMVRANLMTPVDADLIPDGTLAPVSGGAYDFRTARPIRRAFPDGSRVWIDHNFLLRRDKREPSVAAGLEIAHAATVRSPRNGLAMDVWTTEPALQVYDGAKLALTVPGLGGASHGPCAGLCLEPQHVPDSPNLPHFPSTVLRPGAVYRQVSEYRFRAPA